MASLPCYTGENVDDQRGSGVFRRSILALQLLNAAGYGQPGSRLQLDLVYNPNGTFLAPPQAQLQVWVRAIQGLASALYHRWGRPQHRLGRWGAGWAVCVQPQRRLPGPSPGPAPGVGSHA